VVNVSFIYVHSSSLLFDGDFSWSFRCASCWYWRLTSVSSNFSTFHLLRHSVLFLIIRVIFCLSLAPTRKWSESEVAPLYVRTFSICGPLLGNYYMINLVNIVGARYFPSSFVDIFSCIPCTQYFEVVNGGILH